MKRFAVAGAVLFAFAGVAAAQATTAQASLSGYSYQLIDLDTNDGIAPSITFSHLLQGAVASATWPDGQAVEDIQWSEAGEPVSARLDQAGAGGTAWFSPDLLKASSSGGNGGYYFSIAGWDADYTLSANTKLVVTGRVSGSLNIDGADTEHFASAHASVWFNASGQNTGSGYLAYYSRSVRSSDPASGNSFDEDFELELVNDSASTISATMSVNTRTVVAGVSPVPEPSTYLMLGTGLLLTAAVARRRRVPRAN